MYERNKPELALQGRGSEVMSCTDEQQMLMDTAAKFCREKSDFNTARSLMETDRGFNPDLWNELAELGWLGLAIPQDYGGSGLSLAELVPLVEETGRALMHTPLQTLTTAVLALNRAGTSAQKQAWLPRIAEGSVVTVALSDANHWNFDQPECTATARDGSLLLSGTKQFVADLGCADAVIASVALEGAPALVLIPRELIADSAIDRQVITDEIKRCYRLNLDGIQLPREQLLTGGDAAATIRHISLAGTLLLSAEMIGGQAAALDLLVEYATTRHTFGRPIGSYQGVKHPAADMLCHYEDGRSHLYYAATQFRTQPDAAETEIAIRMTKAYMSDKCLYAGDRVVQFHGGIGFTWECNAQLFLRRALFAQSQFGDGMHHRKRLADLLLGPIEQHLSAS